MELFGKPIFFIYFLFAALAAGAIWLAGGKLKNRAVNAFFGPQAYAKLTAGLRLNHKLNTVFFFAGLFFLFTALARPQWGTEVIQAEGKFAQTVIAVDVSSSMKARDLQPDRLANAKNMLSMLISNLKDERIGIIAFTTKAYIQCPITTDEAALKYFLSSLKPDMLPVPGTALAAPVELAAQMLSKYPGQKALILLTDGEDHEPDQLKQAIKAALENGIRVIAVGIGTQEGELIPQRVDASGKVLEYKKDKNGNTVVSKLDEKSLLELAQATNGAYIHYTTPAQVASKVETSLKDLDRSYSASGSHARYKDRYQIPLGIAILLFCLWLVWPAGKAAADAGSKKVQ